MTNPNFLKELEVEWTNLRAEIFELDKACLNILQYSILLTSGLTVLCKEIVFQNPPNNQTDFFYIALSIIWMLFYVYLYHKRLGIRRIGGYLRVFIESKENTPKWLTCLNEYREKRLFAATFKPELVEALFASIVQIIVAIYFIKNNKVIVIFPILFFCLIYSIYLFLQNFNTDIIWKNYYYEQKKFNVYYPQTLGTERIDILIKIICILILILVILFLSLLVLGINDFNWDAIPNKIQELTKG